MKKSDLTLLKHLAEVTNTEEKFVILKEDETGRYIEYAFKEGCPSNNRCLSWYNKIQPNALLRNGHTVEEWTAKHADSLKLNEVYKLSMFTCGEENNTEHPYCQCKPGEPSMHCKMSGRLSNWTPEEPCKCACWFLKPIADDFEVRLTIEELEQLIIKLVFNSNSY